MNLLRVFFMICFFTSCDRKQNNSQLLESINSISKVDTIYTFEIDELKNIADTLSMQLVKKNDKGFKVYEEIITHSDDALYIIKNYYGDDNKIFYTQKSTTNFGILSILETFKNEDNIISEGLQIFYEDNQPYDTIFLNYSYRYKENRISMMNVDYTDSKKEVLGRLKTLYNDQGDPVEEFFIELNDTLTITNYLYKSDVMYQTKTFDKKNSLTIIQEYKKDGVYEYLKSRRVFKDNKLSVEELSEKDSSGNILLLKRK